MLNKILCVILFIIAFFLFAAQAYLMSLFFLGTAILVTLWEIAGLVKQTIE